MNAKRLGALKKVLSQMQETKSQLDAIAEEEREAFENLSEGLQQSEQGQRTESNADSLEDAVSAFDSALDSIEGVTSGV